MCHPQGKQQELHVLCAAVSERGPTQGEAKIFSGETAIGGPGEQFTTEIKDGTPVLHGRMPMGSVRLVFFKKNFIYLLPCISAH